MQKCIVSFTTDNGREVHAGDMVSNDDPVIRGREDRFEPFEESDADELAAREGDQVEFEVAKDRDVGADSGRRVHTQGEVEEATANPGEKRNTKR